MISEKKGEGCATPAEMQVWQRLREGSMDALSFFYQQNFSRLLAYGRRISGCAELAEDCIQDLFYKIWNKRTNLPEIHSSQGYLFQSYRRLLSDRLKETTRRSELAAPGEETSILSMQDLIIHDEIDSERHEKITRGIASLSKKQKEIIYLRFYQNLSYDEIAGMLEINPQSIRNSICTSLKFLRKILTLGIVACLKMIA